MSTSTILGTNGLNSADVSLSTKQTNKLVTVSAHWLSQFSQQRHDMMMIDDDIT